MIVLDASAAVSALLNAGAARDAVIEEALFAPHLIDTEVMSALRRLAASGRLDAGDAWLVLERWRQVSVRREPIVGVLERIWELRRQLSAYDASYVALAEALDCPLMTADARLAGAHGIGCPVTLVPR